MSGRRLRQVAAVATLGMAALAASHDLTYLLAHGVGSAYARAMQEGGHDRYWTTFVLTIVVVTLVLAIVAARQIRRLNRRASVVRPGQTRVQRRRLGSFARLMACLWLVIAAGTSVAFVAQENLETITAGHRLPWLDVVSGEHAVALPVIALVSLLVALVGALIQWGRHVWLARLRRSIAPLRRRMSRTLRPPFVARPRSTVAAFGHGLRAPPALVPSLV